MLILNFLSPSYGTLVHACCRFSSEQLSATPWTVAHQAPLSVGFPRQEYQSGLPFPSPGDLPHTGIDPASLMSPALASSGRFFTTSTTWEVLGDRTKCLEISRGHVEKKVYREGEVLASQQELWGQGRMQVLTEFCWVECDIMSFLWLLMKSWIQDPS